MTGSESGVSWTRRGKNGTIGKVSFLWKRVIMKYKYILFDLDGTITESGPGIMNSAEYALKKMNREVGDRETLRKFIGPPLTESMEKYYGMSREESLLGVKYYREYYEEKGMFENSVYAGIPEILDSLKKEGYILAVATSKPEIYARKIADKFGFTKYFAGVYGATMDEALIRKADVIRHALEEMHVPEEMWNQVLMVGDRDTDVYGAGENNIKVIGVLYGYGDLEELQGAGADYIARTPEDITKIIRECNHERI